MRRGGLQPIGGLVDRIVARTLPPGFRILSDGPDRELLVNHNGPEHISEWDTPSAAREAAWDWWHDVRGMAADD